MRLVLQRVSSAAVAVEGRQVSSIGRGYLLFLGVEKGDTGGHALWMAEKVAKARLFPNEGGKLNDRSILDAGGAALVVSQFTLAGSLENGNRPDFFQAAPPEEAKPLYEQFAAALRESGIPVEMGVFGAFMEVALRNDGPCTILLQR